MLLDPSPSGLANKYPLPYQLLQEQYQEELEPLRRQWGLLAMALPALGLLALLRHPELVGDLIEELGEDYDEAGHLDQLYAPARSLPEGLDPIVVNAVKVSRYLD